MGDKNKNLSINASTVKFNDSFGSLTINGIQSFTSNQVISLSSSGIESFYGHIDPSSLKNFPTMMVFGIKIGRGGRSIQDLWILFKKRPYVGPRADFNGNN